MINRTSALLPNYYLNYLFFKAQIVYFSAWNNKAAQYQIIWNESTSYPPKIL